MSTSGGRVGGINVATAHLTAAEILTLFTAATEVVPAPAAGTAIVVLGASFEFVPGVTGYAPGDVQPFYGDPAGDAYAAQVASGLMDPAHLGGAPTHAFAVVADGTQTPVVTLVDGVAITVAADASDPTLTGPIVTSALNVGGTGYAPGDTGSFDVTLWGAAATYVVDTVDGITGAVLTYHLDTVGGGYNTTANPQTTTAGGSQPGIGTGLTIDVTAIPPADGDLYATVTYMTVTLH